VINLGFQAIDRPRKCLGFQKCRRPASGQRSSGLRGGVVSRCSAGWPARSRMNGDMLFERRLLVGTAPPTATVWSRGHPNRWRSNVGVGRGVKWPSGGPAKVDILQWSKK